MSASRQGLIETAAADHGLPGIVAAVARRGELEWAGAAGSADVEAGTALTPEHQMRVASITKMFTATSIFMLRDEGRLGLDDPITTHVPEFPDGTRTIRHLLCHGSGLQRETPDDPGWRGGSFLSGGAFLDALGRATLPFAPMQHFKYSNLGYGSLGEVVARASGVPYTDFVRERVLTPLGLSSCGFEPDAIPVERRCKGYLPKPDTDEVAEDERAWGGVPEAMGGLHATASDLCTFVSFLAGFLDGPLDEETRREMRYPAIPTGPGLQGAYALGPELVREGDAVLMGHAGGLFSFASLVLIDLATGTSCAALTNVGNGGPLLPLVSELIRETEPAAAGVSTATPVPNELAPLLGRYFGDGAVMLLTWRAGKLLAEMSSPSGVAFPPPIEIDRRGPHLVFRDGSYAGEELFPDRTEGEKVRGLEVCGYRFERI